jgi:hypothetical protein
MVINTSYSHTWQDYKYIPGVGSGLDPIIE